MTKSPARAKLLAKLATRTTSGRSPAKASKKSHKKIAEKTYRKAHSKTKTETEEAAPFFENSRLMAVAIHANSKNLIWRAQSKPNGPWVTDWAPISTTNRYDAMVTGMSREGRVIVVGHAGPTPAVHFYIQSFVDDSWEGPVNLALPPGVPAFSVLATARSADGRINIFGQARDTGNVWWIYQNPEVPKPPNAWSAWQPLAARRLTVMTAGNSGDATIVLAGSVFDAATVHVFYTRQKTTDAKVPADWIPWMDMTQGHFDGYAPAFRLDGGSNLNLFAIGTGSVDVLQTRQLPVNSNSFTPWAFPSMVGQTIAYIATGIDGDNHMVIAAQDKAGKIYVNYMRDRAAQTWSGWQQIADRIYAGPLSLDYNADGRLTLFMREATGDLRLWCISQIAINSTTWEAIPTLLSASALTDYGIARDLTP
jgi:hypothetical protein